MVSIKRFALTYYIILNINVLKQSRTSTGIEKYISEAQQWVKIRSMYV